MVAKRLGLDIKFRPGSWISVTQIPTRLSEGKNRHESLVNTLFDVTLVGFTEHCYSCHVSLYFLFPALFVLAALNDFHA